LEVRVKNLFITTHGKTPLVEFLSMHGFDITELGNGIFKVQKEQELPVFMSLNNEILYFEVDLGNISSIAGEKLYFQLLDLNTEILPVSFGINNTNEKDPRLVLVESRETDDLNEHEILAVFDALELATDKAEQLLQNFI